MNLKIWKKTDSEPRRTNAWSRRKGGAGAVVCAFAVTALILCLAVAGPAESKLNPTASPDEPVSPSDNQDIIPWEKPPVQASTPVHSGATPSRLRC